MPRQLPKDPDKPFKVNGIEFANRKEYDQRVESDLKEFASLLYDIYEDHKARENRLREEPGGFAFPSEGRMCCLCLGGGKGELWFDKLGMRCMDCQEAYKQKIIPGYVFTDRDNKRHATDSDLVVRYKIERRLIKRLIREGKLKARVVSHKQFMNTLIFLKRENPNIRKVILGAEADLKT